MECELCGKEADCKLASIDNVKMMLCSSCLQKHGKSIKESTIHSSPDEETILKRIKKHKEKDVYEDQDLNKVLVNNWNKKIKEARKRKNLSREQFSFEIGEKTATVAKIENADLRPSDKLAKKIEKKLDITLFEEIKDTPSTSSKTSNSRGLTIGDLIKKDK